VVSFIREVRVKIPLQRLHLLEALNPHTLKGLRISCRDNDLLSAREKLSLQSDLNLQLNNLALFTNLQSLAFDSVPDGWEGESLRGLTNLESFVTVHHAHGSDCSIENFCKLLQDCTKLSHLQVPSLWDWRYSTNLRSITCDPQSVGIAAPYPISSQLTALTTLRPLHGLRFQASTLAWVPVTLQALHLEFKFTTGLAQSWEDFFAPMTALRILSLNFPPEAVNIIPGHVVNPFQPWLSQLNLEHLSITGWDTAALPSFIIPLSLKSFKWAGICNGPLSDGPVLESLEIVGNMNLDFSKFPKLKTLKLIKKYKPLVAFFKPYHSGYMVSLR